MVRTVYEKSHHVYVRGILPMVISATKHIDTVCHRKVKYAMLYRVKI